ncbi:MAG: adenylate/guanylate cyclase domain-containing protein [Spirochaetes bacterium]|nr:adenylate/guanylate cyclase domain-containing protein [Spirochaetota bacterium]
MPAKSKEIKSNFLENKAISGIIIGLICFVFIALFSFSNIYESFENRFYDMRFDLKTPINEWDQLVFLNIDDNSINNVGKYPWPRHYYATALDVLTEVGAEQVTFDMEFPDPSPDQVDIDVVNYLQKKVQENMKISNEELSAIILNNDNIFAEGLKKYGRAILPYHFLTGKMKFYDLSTDEMEELKNAQKIFTNIASVPVPKGKLDKYFHLIDREDVDIARPIPILVSSAYNFGFTDSDFDSDGVARKKKLINVYDGRIYFEMALVMLMDICKVKKENVEIYPGRRIVLKNALNPLTYEKKDISIPVDSKGRMYINWAGEGPFLDSFKHVPFYGLIEYTEVKDEIHNYFNGLDMEDESRERIGLFSDLDRSYTAFRKAMDSESRRTAWNDISNIKKKIADIEDKYESIIKDEITKYEAEYEKNKSTEAAEIVGQYKNYLKAINIVRQVESLKDKICIAGLIATGTQDVGATPIDNNYPMVGTYINIINTVLNESFIIKVNKYFNLIIMLILAVVIGVLVQMISAKKSIIAIVLSLVILNFVNILLFSYYNIWIEQLGTNLAFFLPSSIIAASKLMKEESQKRYIKNAFSRYLAPGVIDQIIESPEALELGGEEREITIFFSDIAGFSTISEKLTPPELVARLNEYLSAMTEIILSHGGTVDKYEGDAIMAFYGAPQSFEDHALRCCLASIDMKKKLRELQDSWKSKKIDVMKVRMGINSGKAVVGNMGSTNRLDYTAMGDSVNLASRLEGVNKFYNTYAMISETTYELVRDDVEVRKLDTVRVVGKEEPIVIYELLGRKGQLPERMYLMMEKYYAALDLFGNREWKRAINKFKEGLKIIKDDGPSLKYIERCEQFIKRPPSKSWDGVYKMTSK